MKSISQIQPQFPQPPQPSQTQTGQYQEAEQYAYALLINKVFAQLKNTFGRKFSSRFKTVEEVKETKRTWLLAFKKEQVTEQQAQHALGQCIEQRLEWPPEINEFLILCDSCQSDGLPNEQQAFEQIIQRHGRDRFKKSFAWLHPIVNYIDQRIGQYANKEAESSFLKRFKTEWKAALTLHKSGVLPQPRKALPPPDLPAPIEQFKHIEPDQDILDRMNNIREIKGQS